MLSLNQWYEMVTIYFKDNQFKYQTQHLVYLENYA
jgi:hypothetical protein